MKLIRRILGNILPSFSRCYLRHRIKCHRTARIYFEDRLDIDEYVYIGPDCVINAEGYVQIGTGTILGPEVVILSSSHDYRTGNLLPYDKYDVHRSVSIGAGVWIGYRAMICPGVSIGNGAVIAMGAVVTSSVGSGRVVGGNPAKVITTRDISKIEQMISSNSFFHQKYWSGNRPRAKSKNT